MCSVKKVVNFQSFSAEASASFGYISSLIFVQTLFYLQTQNVHRSFHVKKSTQTFIEVMCFYYKDVHFCQNVGGQERLGDPMNSFGIAIMQL